MPSEEYHADARPVAAGSLDTDVCVIGAGVAGSCVAHLLRQHGVRAVVVDPHARSPTLFRVEKLTAHQLTFLERFELLDRLAPIGSRVAQIAVAHHGRVAELHTTTEWCFRYHELVNALREGLELDVGHVAKVEFTETAQRVAMADGRSIRARLVVLASGASVALHAALGVERVILSRAHSTSFGFSIRTVNGAFPHDEVTYFPERFGDRIDYITLFPVPGDIRANLFTYHDVRSPFVSDMKRNPDAALGRVFPRLQRVTGAFTVTGPVPAVPMDLWVSRADGRPGFVMIGDAFQSACPATGRGCTKALNDAEVLASHAVAWLATPGMGGHKIASYYADARKRAVDDESVEIARYLKRLRTDTGIRMRIHRAKEAFMRGLGAVRRRAAARKG